MSDELRAALERAANKQWLVTEGDLATISAVAAGAHLDCPIPDTHRPVRYACDECEGEGVGTDWERTGEREDVDCLACHGVGERVVWWPTVECTKAVEDCYDERCNGRLLDMDWLRVKVLAEVVRWFPVYDERADALCERIIAVLEGDK